MRIFHVLGLSRLQTSFAALLVLAVFTFVWHYSLNRTPAPANSRSGKLTDFSGYCSAASFNGKREGALINLRIVVLLTKISKSLVTRRESVEVRVGDVHAPRVPEELGFGIVVIVDVICRTCTNRFGECTQKIFKC